MPDPIVLAFSGGLDTSFSIPWLAETLGRPVVTVTVDTGGLDAAAAEDLARRSRVLGAVDHLLIDARQDFFDRVLRFLILGNVRRGQVYPLCVGAERVIQAQEVAKAAARLGSRTVAHGCTAAGNDQVRFEVALRTLDPGLEILAPVRDEPRPRPEQVAYLEARGLPVPPFGAAYSINRGLWGVTIGGQETLDTVASIPESAWVLTRGAFDAPLRAVAPHGRLHGGRAVRLGRRGARAGRADREGRERRRRSTGSAAGSIWARRSSASRGGSPSRRRPPRCCSPPTGSWRSWSSPAARSGSRRRSRASTATWSTRGSTSIRSAATSRRCSSPRSSGSRARSISSSGRARCSSRGWRRRSRCGRPRAGIYGEAAGEWSAADARGFSRIVALPGELYARMAPDMAETGGAS